MGGGGERHGKSPKANPSYSDGRLFTTSISGILSAWEADSGKLLWRKIRESVLGNRMPIGGRPIPLSPRGPDH